MKIAIVIPARYKSTRLPGKPLADINGKPMIQHVYERASQTNVNDVIVACDHDDVFNCVKSFGGKAVMTRVDHINGSSRIAEVAKLINADVIINVQGDEPLINSEVLDLVIDAIKDENCEMVTLKTEIFDRDEINNPNCVKVISDINNNAIYFSRTSLPYLRENRKQSYYKHIGIYAYKKDFLMKYVDMEPTDMELSESLEQLRVIENGYKIKVIETNYSLIGVDTLEDLEKVRELLK